MLITGAIVAPVTVGTSAQAAGPETPVAAPFDAPLCENTTGNPAVDADGGPVTNLLSVFGQRLADYNDGKPVILYNNSGRSGWTSSGSQYSANPLCATRYVEEAGGPVSSWMYCTYDRASTCGWTNANGELERQGTVLPGLEYLDPDNRLTEDQQKLQSYIIQNDMPVIAGPNGSGGTVAADTVANNDTPQSRSLRQNLVHCIDNPERSSGLVFCENNMSAETQARILELIGSDNAAMLSAAGPAATVAPGAEGEVVVTTSLAGIPLDVTVTGGSVSVCDGPATLSGGVLTVDEDADLPADITLCVTRADAGDVSVSVAGTPPVIENIGFFQSKRYEGDTLCQIFSAVEAERQTTLDAGATVTFGDAPVTGPSIGTSLVDAADGNRVLAWNGGTVTDTVTFSGLDDWIYEVRGELMNEDGTGTGIVGSTPVRNRDKKPQPDGTFSGTVDVAFTVPEGYAGKKLIAFEELWMKRSPDAEWELVASHKDINDAAQTVTVEEAPESPNPVIGTSLVDSADGNRVLAWNGGTVIDTVAYQNLTPGTEYTVTGELMLKSDGSATGIKGSMTFTPTEANGSVDVTFVVPTGFAGEVLVAFEQLFEGADTTGDPVAVHEDINDAAQTVTVEEAPESPNPVIGTSLVDAADQDHVLAAKGGKVVDTVAYQNLTPGTQYTVTGELMLKSDGSATGIKGSATFTATEANGSVDVVFTVPEGFAGKVLVAFEQLFEGTDTTGDPVAVHEDINDAAQTVTVETPGAEKPNGSHNDHLSNTGGSLPWIGAGMAGLLLVAGATLLLARRKHVEQ